MKMRLPPAHPLSSRTVQGDFNGIIGAGAQPLGDHSTPRLSAREDAEERETTRVTTLNVEKTIHHEGFIKFSDFTELNLATIDLLFKNYEISLLWMRTERSLVS